MNYWNYRIFKDERGSFSIREIYYIDDVPQLYSDEPSSPFGGSIDDLKINIEYMLNCLQKPILKRSDFERNRMP